MTDGRGVGGRGEGREKYGWVVVGGGGLSRGCRGEMRGGVGWLGKGRSIRLILEFVFLWIWLSFGESKKNSSLILCCLRSCYLNLIFCFFRWLSNFIFNYTNLANMGEKRSWKCHGSLEYTDETDRVRECCLKHVYNAWRILQLMQNEVAEFFERCN